MLAGDLFPPLTLLASPGQEELVFKMAGGTSLGDTDLHIMNHMRGGADKIEPCLVKSSLLPTHLLKAPCSSCHPPASSLFSPIMARQESSLQ